MATDKDKDIIIGMSKAKNYFTPFLLCPLIDMKNNIIKKYNNNNNNNVRQCLSVCLSDKKKVEM